VDVHGRKHRELDHHGFVHARCVWGDGSATSRVWGPFAPVNGTIYNGNASLQVEGNQDVAGGSYSDSVIFTMSFV
jgi:hypothetical protein